MRFIDLSDTSTDNITGPFLNQFCSCHCDLKKKRILKGKSETVKERRMGRDGDRKEDGEWGSAVSVENFCTKISARKIITAVRKSKHKF
jgi:hypothetical protein